MKITALVKQKQKKVNMKSELTFTNLLRDKDWGFQCSSLLMGNPQSQSNKQAKVKSSDGHF